MGLNGTDEAACCIVQPLTRCAWPRESIKNRQQPLEVPRSKLSLHIRTATARFRRPSPERWLRTSKHDWLLWEGEPAREPPRCTGRVFPKDKSDLADPGARPDWVGLILRFCFSKNRRAHEVRKGAASYSGVRLTNFQMVIAEARGTSPFPIGRGRFIGSYPGSQLVVW